MKKGCVISGGGSRGAYGGGTLQALNNDYQFVVGVSTGSLLSSLTALCKFDKLKNIYTSVNNDSIYSVNPWTKKNKLNLWNAAWRFIKSETSLGEMGNLRKLMPEPLSEEEYKDITKLGKEVISVSQRINPKPYTLNYVSSKEVDYHYFLDLLLASSTIPFAGDIVYVGTSEYLDGGITEVTPLEYSVKKAHQEGIKHLDVIIHRYDMVMLDDIECDKVSTGLYDDTMGDYEDKPTKNMFDLAFKLWEAHLIEKEIGDIKSGVYCAKQLGVDLDIYYLPNRPTMASHHFDKKIMTEWWNTAYSTTINKQARKQEYRFTK